MVALLSKPTSQGFSNDTQPNRRAFERKPSDAEAIGRRIDHTIAARQNPRLCLHVRDLSMGGLAALSDTPVNPGETLSVTIPRRGLIPGWDAFGRVVRCRHGDGGYDVAIEFAPLLAA